MTIAFNQVLDIYRASQIFIEMAGQRRSLASLFIKPKVGIIGTYDSTKSPTDYTPVLVTSKEKVGELYGFGSHLHRQALAMPDAVFDSCEVYCFPVPEADTPTASNETVTFTGAASSAGAYYFGIGGELVSFNVASGDSADTIGAAFAAAITAKRDIAVTAANSSGAVTVTAKFKGTHGDEILIKQNPDGDIQEAQAPGTTTVALENGDGYLDGGVGTPDIEDVFLDSGADKLGDRWYTIFTCPFTDATNLGYIDTAGDLRANANTRRHFGAYAGYVKSTYSQALAAPAVINCKWIGAVYEPRCYAPAFELGAALVGRIAYEQLVAPSRPYKNTPVGLACDSSVDNRKYALNDALFRAGMGYCITNESGNLYFGDIALTYRKTELSAPTEEWFDAVSLHLRQAKVNSLDQIFKAAPYNRGVAVGDADPTYYEWAIAPKDLIADMVKLIEDMWGKYAWTKNVETVIEGLIAEINEANNSREDVQVTDDPAQALRIIAVKYAFLY